MKLDTTELVAVINLNNVNEEARILDANRGWLVQALVARRKSKLPGC